MDKAIEFNPPPNWPAPPPGFRPGAQWAPDPSWPPAPPGWELWRVNQAKAKLFYNRPVWTDWLFYVVLMFAVGGISDAFHDGGPGGLTFAGYVALFLNLAIVPFGALFLALPIALIRRAVRNARRKGKLAKLNAARAVATAA